MDAINLETSTIQKIMNQAYERWQKHKNWDQITFWKQLSNREMMVVFVGNMNYQVENGGWSQWHDNGYSACSGPLKKILRALGTPGQHAANLLGYALPLCKRMERAQEKIRSDRVLENVCYHVNLDLTKYDNLYYEIKEYLLIELEEIAKLSDEEFEGWWAKNGLPQRKIKVFPMSTINIDWAPGVL